MGEPAPARLRLALSCAFSVEFLLAQSCAVEISFSTHQRNCDSSARASRSAVRC